ncbi:MAG TPA: hypothetical protein VMI73_27300 [Trebonia sp.]|nr:hypothetical protein [Trebonia sp.]
MVASSWLTICWALASPASVELDAEADADELAAGELLVAGALELEVVLLELQAASTAAAVTAAPGASQRFHLCVIAFGSSIPPITSGA